MSDVLPPVDRNGRPSPSPGATANRGLSLAGTVLESARQTFCLMLLGSGVRKLLLVMVGVGGLAALLTSTARGRADPNGLFCLMAWWGIGTVVVPWLTLYLGVQAVHGELEQRTSSYLFTRPVHRAPLLLGKWLGVSAMAALLVLFLLVVLFLAVLLGAPTAMEATALRSLGAFATVLSLGVVAYAAAAMMFAAWFRRPLAVAALFVVGVQMLAANLPVSAGLRSMTITDPLRRLLLEHLQPAPWLASALWPAERGEALEVFRTEQAAGGPLPDLARVLVVCLLIACSMFTMREYEARRRD